VENRLVSGKKTFPYRIYGMRLSNDVLDNGALARRGDLHDLDDRADQVADRPK